MALGADGAQHQYRFTLDDQPLGPLGRLPKQEGAAVEQLYEIARHLEVDVKDLLISTK